MASCRMHVPPRNPGRERGVTLYYNGDDVRITHEVFQTRSPFSQSFPIEELRYVHTVKFDRIEALVARPQVGVCSTGLTGAVAIFTIVEHATFGHPLVTIAAVGALAAAAAVAGACWSAQRRPLELRAMHRGRLVCLLSTTDRRMFGEVTRALVRVLEWREDTH
jgi:hypothetical protein